MERPERVPASETGLVLSDLKVAWPMLSVEERLEGLLMLPEEEAEDFFLGLGARDQIQILKQLPPLLRRTWLRVLPLDDAAAVIRQVPLEERDALLSLLDPVSRKEVVALLAYEEDEAGGLMNPKFARLRPEMTADEALLYLRRQARERDTRIYYAYVLGPDQKLLGVLSLRQLLMAPSDRKVEDVMIRELTSIGEDMDQEAIAPLLSEHGLLALPVVDKEGRMKGIVTAEDIVVVVTEEATEDIQKLGGVQVLEAPYLDVGVKLMFRKRSIWLTVLFFGEMLTITAMGFFEHQLEQLWFLPIFLPLILSSGGNSGSQASTLVIRALALGELRLRDWWRVMRRELLVGACLGGLLAVFGLLRVMAGPMLGDEFGEDFLRLSIVVGGSLLCVVTFGTLLGSTLPLILRRLNLDPATASTPFVATMSDVTGLLIYFSVARAFFLDPAG